MKSETTRLLPLLLPLTLTVLVAGSPAFGQTTNWTGATGDWFTPGNWSAGVPDALSLIEIQNGGTAQIASGSALGRNLYVGSAPGSTGNLSLSGTSILSLMEILSTPGGVGFLEIGTSGTGIVEVSDSARLILLDTRVGNGSGGNGTLNVSGGIIESADLVIGAASPATVNLSGTGIWQGWSGQAGLGATLRVGSQGTLNLSGTASWISDGGGNNRINGVVNVRDNATVSTIRRTWIGVAEGDAGSLNVSGGSYALTDLWVGLDGLGELEISGTGSVSSESGELGLNALGTGTAVVSGGSWTNAGTLLIGTLGQGSLAISESGVVSNLDSAITVGVSGTGALTITDGGSLSSASAIIAQNANSIGTVVISDGTWTNTGGLTVGSTGDGSLTVSDGATVSSMGVAIAQHVDSTASVDLNSGASLQVPGGTVSVGFGGGFNGTTGNATLTVDGATVSAHQIDVNAQGTGSASLSVSGNSSISTNEVRFASQGSSLVPDTVSVSLTGGSWTNSGTMILGTGADAEINVSGTASITSQDLTLWGIGGTILSVSGGSLAITNRFDSTALGVTRVSGGGIVSAGEFLLRQGSTVQIFDGGQVFATNLRLGRANSPATFTVSGTSGSRGVLETPQISYDTEFGADPGVMVFDGGIFRAAADQTTLFSGFSPGNVRLEAGGGFFDSNGFSLATSFDISGPGGLTKQGSGTLTLAGSSSYAGPTDIQGGELRVNGSTGAGAVQVAAGGVLSGTGTVAELQVAGGTLAPGVGGVGTLSAGDTSFGGGTFMVEISSAASADMLSVNGTAGLTANTELVISEINGIVSVPGDSWTIIDNDGVDAFSLGNFRFTAGGIPIEPLAPFVVAGIAFHLDFLGGDGNDLVLVRVERPNYQVTPSASAGGSIDPATPQTVALGDTTAFALSADAGFYLSEVLGSCGGSLAGDVYSTEPITADCSVQAHYLAQIATVTTIDVSANPVRVGEAVSFNVEVSGASAPSDGLVIVTANSGETCVDSTPKVKGDSASFSCQMSFPTLGPRTLSASFSDSVTHFSSSSAMLDLSVARIADLSVSISDGQDLVLPGESLSYLIEVRNAGPDAAPGSLLVLASMPELQNTDWTCSPVGAASCPAVSGTGELGESVDLPAGSGLDFVQNGLADSQLDDDLIVMVNLSGSAEAPNFVFDPANGNNQATDVNLPERVFADGFE